MTEPRDPSGTSLSRAVGLGVDAVLDAVLDRALGAAVERAGAPGRIRFTERQLYYETCRVLHPARALPRGVPLTPGPPVPYERFARALERRRTDRAAVPGPAIPGLLPPLPPPVPPERPDPLEPRPGDPAPAAPAEPDLHDYGLPRLLVCQSRSVARMLLANDVHLEAACPVFAAADLPLDPRLTAGLGRAEGATVHVLHDAGAEGIALTARVRATLRDAVPGVRVTSLGLVPRHAVALRLFSRPGESRGADGRAADGRAASPLPELPAALEAREVEWLARGRAAEVEAVPPARLLRTVLRLVRGPRTPGHSVRSGLRELRTTGFLTWPGDPARRPEDTRR
ncbi:hypothetical protein AB0O07_15950 [Streptomyces sp. NPDC093085]|uniref:hypothetical protein n=1 Tax=Streptomyces sp. NPDC093085 TaxID=3155068 RepID=UPI00343999C6